MPKVSGTGFGQVGGAYLGLAETLGLTGPPVDEP